MANIKEYLTQIKNAVYGKDFRQAIYDGMNDMNTEIDILADNFNKIFGNTKTELKNKFDSNLKTINLLNEDDTINILKYNDNTGYWDLALKTALKTNKIIYFPEGIYLFKENNYNLNEGNIICGDGVYKTILKYVGDENLNENMYFFKMITKTGFKGVQLAFKNDFGGKAIFLDANSVNVNNRYYTLSDVFINFNWAGGYGTGLCVLVKNYDDQGNVFTDGRDCGCVYFHSTSLEVAYAEKGIEILLSQKGSNISNPCWITENIYTYCNLNSCLYGLYFHTDNTSDTALENFNVNFSKLSIQLKDAGFFRSSKNMSIGMFLEGEAQTKTKNTPPMMIVVNNASIWDSPNGVNGIIKNCRLTLSDTFISNYISDSNTYYGFQHDGTNNNLITVNGDCRYHDKICSDTGKPLEVTNIDGGLQYLHNPETNGWDCLTQVTYTRVGDEQVYKVENQNVNSEPRTIVYSTPNNIQTRQYLDSLNTFLANDISLTHHIVSLNIEEGVKIYQIDLTKIGIDAPNPIVVGVNRIQDIGDSINVNILSTSINNKTLSLKLEKNGTDKVIGTYGITLLYYKNY